uniref:Uncharacterized protein n=1 Tax=Arundo donax TaxID=35708 RepID=A0A0A9Q1Q7_ARUDO
MGMQMTSTVIHMLSQAYKLEQL